MSAVLLYVRTDRKASYVYYMLICYQSSYRVTCFGSLVSLLMLWVHFDCGCFVVCLRALIFVELISLICSSSHDVLYMVERVINAQAYVW